VDDAVRASGPVVETAASAAVAGNRSTRPDETGHDDMILLLIPAEQDGIGRTLDHVLSQLAHDDRYVVVCDNCSNRRAEIALAAVESRDQRSHLLRLLRNTSTSSRAG
jgi:hypothetical protein